jgi:hypothetical protein
MILATKTKAAINSALELDEGAKFRGLFKEALSEVSDCFSTKPELIPRKHLGASVIGKKCARALWYGFRWAYFERHEGRIIRLFQRGHLEEARFIALMRLIGMQTWHLDNGKQLRLTDCGGYFGGSLDGIGRGCPDLPDEPFLLEFKTHNKASFERLVAKGVEQVKPEHAIQCNTYMGKFGLRYALYVAVNKNDDDLHCEILTHEQGTSEWAIERADRIIASPVPPPKIAECASDYNCKYCSAARICHHGADVLHNCRTCANARRPGDGKWSCPLKGIQDLTPEEQFAGCPAWVRGEGL